MLDSHYVLVFVDMFLGCVVGYLIAPYVNKGIEKLYNEVKKREVDFSDITLEEAKSLYEESVSEATNHCIEKIKESILNKEFSVTANEAYVVANVQNREIVKRVREYFQDLEYPVLVVGMAGTGKYWVYVFVEGDGSETKACECPKAK